MKKISFLTIIFTGFIFLANSQDLKFNEREFDFGEIKEMDGKVSHKFLFTNNSKKSIQILTVKPSCGCTTPDWSKKEVKPGKEGFIVACNGIDNKISSNKICIYVDGYLFCMYM